MRKPPAFALFPATAQLLDESRHQGTLQRITFQQCTSATIADVDSRQPQPIAGGAGQILQISRETQQIALVHGTQGLESRIQRRNTLFARGDFSNQAFIRGAANQRALHLFSDDGLVRYLRFQVHQSLLPLRALPQTVACKACNDCEAGEYGQTETLCGQPVNARAHLRQVKVDALLQIVAHVSPQGPASHGEAHRPLQRDWRAWCLRRYRANSPAVARTPAC